MPVPLLGGFDRTLGLALGLAGGGLMAVAVVQMGLARTTVVPRRAPNALVTTGIFALSRNPIYLGDALVLAGACLWFEAIPALPLVVLFMAVIQRRFIRGEEAVLRAHFGAEFDAWAAHTRRWA